jgi:hypothetical protein
MNKKTLEVKITDDFPVFCNARRPMPYNDDEDKNKEKI